jgi:hypothetical protein
MITNQQYLDLLRGIGFDARNRIRRLRLKYNPLLRLSHRSLILSELPQNPLRIVQYAAQEAMKKHGWTDTSWGIDEQGCWISATSAPWLSDEPNYFVAIERKPLEDQDQELYSALRILQNVLSGE